ncbi:hypothetical protein E2C01_051812 [Portunus trituberculatus]|uniref:Uncharacterized protein n=1 Tax=Portunus trituberculatus TaxID=210409 RepID=A0A5B7GMR5_PORTR|nr:hypothetical protein [Portunus trituberculatus]
MARIVSLIPGRDGNPRAATILLKGRVTRRPINKLYRLEASQDININYAGNSGPVLDADTPPVDEPPSPQGVTTLSGRLVTPPQPLGL